MKIAVIGTGYVGLVSGACFAELGFDVTCVDREERKISMLRQGDVPIFEPGLEEVLSRGTKAGRLQFTSDLAKAVKSADFVFLAVGTPTRVTGHPDLSQVYAAAKELATHLSDYTVVVTKSTVPVGTNRIIEQSIRTANPDADFDIASNPEFLREGAALSDFMEPDRIVVGTNTDRARKYMNTIYKPLVSRGATLLHTDIESAEMIKYASNAFLATKITFINEIAGLCEKVGGDIQHVSEGMGLDHRIGKAFLKAGPGYGGSCFPKDTAALAYMGRVHHMPITVVEAVIAANNATKSRMIEKIRELCDGVLTGKKVAVFGVTFKPNTDDMREASSLTIVPALLEGGATVNVVDPQGRRYGEALLGNVNWIDNPYIAAEEADATVILTEWDVFRTLDLKRLADVMAKPRLADLRNIYRPEEVISQGFEAFVALGRSENKNAH